MELSLAGTVAIATGGGSGLGRGFARALSEAGAAVAVTGRREGPLAETVAERLLERGRVGRVGLEQPERLRPEPDRRRRRDAIGRHVQGVQWLARGPVLGEATPMLGLGLGGPLEQV